MRPMDAADAVDWLSPDPGGYAGSPSAGARGWRSISSAPSPGSTCAPAIKLPALGRIGLPGGEGAGTATP